MQLEQTQVQSCCDTLGVPNIAGDIVPGGMPTYVNSWVKFRHPALILLLAIMCNAILAAILPTRTRYGSEPGAIAASIAEGKGFSSPFRQQPTGPSAWIPPIFPYLLAIIFRVFGVFTVASFRAATAFNIVVHAATCLLLYEVAGQVLGRRVGLYSAYALASFPLVFYPLTWLHLLPGQAEGGARSLFIPPTFVGYSSLSALAILVLIFYTLQPPHWSVHGIAWGVSALINPTVLAFAPAFVFYLLRHRQSRRYVALVACVGALCISPWLVRNYVVFHHFIPIRDNFGIQLKLGNQPGEKGIFNADIYPTSNPYELKRVAELGEAEYDAEAQREAVKIIRAHPAEFAVNTIRRFGYWWLGIPVESQTLGRLWFVKNLALAAFSGLAFCGAVIASQKRNRSAWLFVAVLLFYPVVYYVTQTFSMAYMYPIHPEMLALATSAVLGKTR
jgi:hypothetical protein